MLSNKTYTGVIVYAGEEHPGNHEAIISRDLFDRVQDRLPKRNKGSRPNAQTYPYLLTSMIFANAAA